MIKLLKLSLVALLLQGSTSHATMKTDFREYGRDHTFSFNLSFCVGAPVFSYALYKYDFLKNQVPRNRPNTRAALTVAASFFLSSALAYLIRPLDMWYLKKMASLGIASYQNSLGYRYMEGHGVEKNEAAALKWTSAAALQGHAVAQNNLGWIHAYGLGVPQNTEEALKWYRLAADKGLASSFYNMGLMHLDGRGKKIDKEEAKKNLQAAADKGHVKAIVTLKRLMCFTPLVSQ